MNGIKHRKKVAILLPWMKMGGTNKIALNFMRELVEYCDVTLILSDNSGELLSDIPKQVHLIIDEMKDVKQFFKEDVKKFKIRNIVKDLVYYYRVKSGKDTIDNYRYIVERNEYICDEEFDYAISYHGQSPERLLNLLYRVKSKKKAAWIHGEFNNSTDHYRRIERYYNKLDELFFVSKPTLESFADKMMLDRNKAIVYYNPIDKEEIITKAQEECNPKIHSGFFNIVTVGRVSSEKGQDMIPAITRNLINNGHKIHWYIIGDGPLRNIVEQKIKQYGVKDSVILLGTRTNPYCYIKECDLYVQPSYTEGYSTTICEAGILGKAIVGTESSGGIKDQITDGEDGAIVEANVDQLSKKIEELICNNKLRNKFENNIKRKNFEGKGEIQKILKKIE